MFWRTRVSFSLVTLLLVMSATSCHSERVSVHAVYGRVLVEGKPAENAVVVFHPLGESGQPQMFQPRGRTDAEGRFKLKTYRTDDGAPPGKYQVAIAWPGPVPPEGTRAYAHYETQGKKDLLNGRYNDPATSGLEATVSSGINELPTFELK